MASVSLSPENEEMSEERAQREETECTRSEREEGWPVTRRLETGYTGLTLLHTRDTFRNLLIYLLTTQIFYARVPLKFILPLIQNQNQS